MITFGGSHNSPFCNSSIIGLGAATISRVGHILKRSSVPFHFCRKSELKTENVPKNKT